MRGTTRPRHLPRMSVPSDYYQILRSLETKGVWASLLDTSLLHTQLVTLAETLGEVESDLGIVGYGDPHTLPVHTEGVHRDLIPRFLILGCIQRATEGGCTTVYDARAAAEIVLRDAPELAHTLINYKTRLYPEGCTRKLVELTSRGPVLRFRQRVHSNTVDTPSRQLVRLGDVFLHRWRSGTCARS